MVVTPSAAVAAEMLRRRGATVYSRKSYPYRSEIASRRSLISMSSRVWTWGGVGMTFNRPPSPSKVSARERGSLRSVAQPRTQHGNQVGAVDRLGDVVRRSGFYAFLSVSLHRLGGERDDRPLGEGRKRAHLCHRGVAVHLRHHHVD